MSEARPDRGKLELNSEECKGCGLCVEACPPKTLRLAACLNRSGYHPVTYRGSGCPATIARSAPASESSRSGNFLPESGPWQV